MTPRGASYLDTLITRRDQQGLLRVGGQGGVPATDITAVLDATQRVYNSSLAFDAVLLSLVDTDDARSTLGWQGVFMHGRTDLGATVWPSERLVVKEVRLSSPGFWLFVGKLNPLEFLRAVLADRHERRKDRAYREREEARRLSLENDMLQLEVIRRRIDIARELGIPEPQLALAVQQLLLGPALDLSEIEARGLLIGSDTKVSRPQQ